MAHDWNDNEMWEGAIQQAERLDSEEAEAKLKDKGFVWGDLYEDRRI